MGLFVYARLESFQFYMGLITVPIIIHFVCRLEDLALASTLFIT